MANEKILIVEDESNMRTMLTLELESAGYQVFQAEDGDSGFQVASAVKPDLIISDILMPQVDGNQFMKNLRESVFGRDIPFIVVSARGQMQDYFEMMNVDDFIAKPFDAEDLLKRVAVVLEKSAKKKEANGDGKVDANRKKKILILDDESKSYEKFKKALMDRQYEVESAKSVSECVNNAAAFKPDVVALRFIIDRMNGDKLVQSLKESPEIEDVPCIVYSQKIRGWEEQKVIDAGAVSFVGEVTEEKLLEAIEKAVK